MSLKEKSVWSVISLQFADIKPYFSVQITDIHKAFYGQFVFWKSKIYTVVLKYMFHTENK